MLSLYQETAAPRERATIVHPFARVLAGIDFSPASLAAARWAAEHVARDAHMILAHVATAPGDVRDAVVSPQRDDGRLITALTGGLDGFAAILGVASTRSIVRCGRASDRLGYLAAAAEASLIVLGRRSDANRSRIGEPNVIARVTRRTGASVLVVPETVKDPPRCIVAAVDRGAIGEQVVATARALADRNGYSVLVLHVVPPTTGAYVRVIGHERRGHVSLVEEMDERKQAAPEWLLERARRDQLFTRDRTRVAAGDPAREIMTVARRLGAAMIVVGKRGEDETPVGSVGSVARELLAKASVPVLAVDGRPHSL